MKCTLCGYEFDENKARGACRGCAFSKGCDLVRCPNCGMDIPRTPKWIGKLALLFKKKDASRQNAEHRKLNTGA